MTLPWGGELSLPDGIGWKSIVSTAVVILAWYAGQAGWVLIGPGDKIARLERSDSTKTAVIAAMRNDLTFVKELLCTQVLSDSGRSTGDRLLQQRCEFITQTTSIGLRSGS